MSNRKLENELKGFAAYCYLSSINHVLFYSDSSEYVRALKKEMVELLLNLLKDEFKQEAILELCKSMMNMFSALNDIKRVASIT